MSPRKAPFRPGVVELEPREVPAVLAPSLVNGILTVTCDSNSTTVIIDQSTSALRIQDVGANRSWTYAPGKVVRVDVYGGIGDDRFTVRGNNGIRARLYGSGGNDTIYGGQGRDIIDGGGGNDKLYGRGGNDVVLGGSGDDYIDGGAGHDILSGDAGDDQVNGGLGTDAISGGFGNDVLVAIDNGTTDTVDGGPGVDTLWLDRTGAVSDGQTGIDGLDVVHQVTAFANGADRTINGDRIADPQTANGEVYETFSNRPLFPTDGPSIDDIVQAIDATPAAVLDDGWLLAGLGAVAEENPDLIKQHIVDFGDGTYGVALGTVFYRVDNDLPVGQFGNLSPAYAQLGADNSIWAAIYEKAFAQFQTGTADYASLEPTGTATPGGTPSNVFSGFNLAPSSAALSLFADTIALGDFVKGLIDVGTPTVLSVTTPGAGSALTANQAYTVLNYAFDNQGNVAYITVRNPWGIDGGGSTDTNPNDGLIRVTMTQLLATVGVLESGG